MSTKNLNILLGVIGVILAFGIFLVVAGFPIKEYSAFGQTGYIVMAGLYSEGDMNFGLHLGAIVILLGYIATFVMLFMQKRTAYIGQCVALLGALILILSVPSIGNGVPFVETSISFGYWIIIAVTLIWGACLYLVDRKADNK